MSISKTVIEEIRQVSRIEEVVPRFVPSLKKRGQNYTGLCPFHKEKTPSFVVSPDKQIFHCFGCHAGGNVFSFISKIENLSFADSVRYLGRMYSIEVRDENDSLDDRLKDYYKCMEISSDIFHRYLLSYNGKKGLDYLQMRGISEKSINLFKLGYSPDSWDFIKTNLDKNGIDLSCAFDCGLLSRKEGAGDAVHMYDKFRDRVIFPILDRFGRVIAFGGRVMDNGEPKYLNSPETKIYQKRKVLYGLNEAHKYITEKKQAIIVEGYLDVIGCFQHGIRNVVAPLGTALTDQQILMLSRICSEIVLLFDSDNAGFKAAVSAVELHKQINTDVKLRVALLPEGDPFDYVSKYGGSALIEIINNAEEPVIFQLNNVLKNNPVIDTSIIKSLFRIIDTIEYGTERSAYIKYLSEKLKISNDILADDFSKYKNNAPVKELVPERNIIIKNDEYIIKSFRELFNLLFNYPELISSAALDFSEFSLNDPVIKSIFDRLCEIAAFSDEITISKLFDYFTDSKEREVISSCVLFDYSVDEPRKAYSEIYLNLKSFNIDNKINYYNNLIKSGDGEISSSLLELEQWRKEKEKLRDFVYNIYSFHNNILQH